MNPFSIPKSTCPKCLCFQTMPLPNLCLSNAWSPICVRWGICKTIWYDPSYCGLKIMIYGLDDVCSLPFRVSLANLVLAQDVTTWCLLIKSLNGWEQLPSLANPSLPLGFWLPLGPEGSSTVAQSLARALGPRAFVWGPARHTPVQGLIKYSCTRWRLSTK